MQYKIIIFLYVIIVFQMSCGEGAKENDQNHIDIENIFNSFKGTGDYTTIALTDDEVIFESEPIIHIGERYDNEEFMFGEIKKVISFEQKLYVLDSMDISVKWCHLFRSI